MVSKVVVLGAGIGGKLATVGIQRNFPGCQVTLVGPESKNPEGLFYFNEKIEGIADKPVDVTYRLVSSDAESPCDRFTEDDFIKYQIKSRGQYSPNVKISSFDKIGQSEKGFLLNSDINVNDVWIKEECVKIEYFSGKFTVTTRTGFVIENIDRIVSTIPFNCFVKLTYNLDIKDSLKYTPVYVVSNLVSPEDMPQVDRINVFYDSTDGPYYRHSSYYSTTDGTVVKTTSESIDPSCYHTDAIYPGKIIPGYPSCKINGKEEVLTPDFIESSFNGQVKLLGRFARWDYHYLVTDTYKDTLKFAETWF